MTVQPRAELAAALRSCRSAFIGVAILSGLINVLMLTGSFFMLLVYDRVLPSRSVPTLLGLAFIATSLFIFLGVFDAIRGRVLVRIGSALDAALSQRVYDALIRLPLKARATGDGLQPLRDLDQLRSFLSSGGPSAMFDLPWMPLYLAICFLFHPWIGLAATAGAVVVVALTIVTEKLSQRPAKAATEFGVQRYGIAAASRRNAEVLQAMGMARNLSEVWGEANAKHIASQEAAADVGGVFGTTSRVVRMILQSAVLGIGAYLVINQQASAGIIIAGAILTSRALAPVELVIANWRGFLAARLSWSRLSDLLKLLPPREQPIALPPPSESISVEGVSATPPGGRNLIVQDVSFRLKAGQALAVIGPTASGKSSLMRVLVGVWQPVRGKVRLDGAALEQWSSEALGRNVGYLPQDVELFAGTIAQNIARFDPTAKSDGIIAAAKAANVHELILSLPDGYETQIGEAGMALSAGQRQRIALAAALFGNPFLVVLDEPNSNLDAEGEEALRNAMLGVRARGGIVIVVAHRTGVLAAVDYVLAMAHGRCQAFGPKDEVLSKVLRGPVPSASPLRVAEASAPKT